MSTLFIVAAFFAILHFVYEGIIAPGQRIRLRNKLFVLRDRLRAVRIEGVDAKDDPAFWYVHDGINALLSRLHSLTVSARATTELRHDRDAELRQRVDARMAMLRECSNPQIKKIFDEASSVIEEAFIVNMGGWMFYLVPVAILWVCLGQLKTLASELLVLPEKDSRRLLPSTG